LIIFITMGVVANSLPNYAGAAATYGISAGPVQVQKFVTQPIFNQVNGVFNMVFAYGGAMIFPEIMAEMRRPNDFIKGMACAQTLIFTAYLLFGVFVYCFQGQFTLPLAYQGLSGYAWQSATNVIAMVTGIIAAGLYGNIGLKVIYHNFVEDMFRGPRLMSPKGRVIWVIMVLVYWSLAFVIASAIPSVGPLSGLIAAMAIFQFTYTFPPLFLLGFQISVDAAVDDEAFSEPGIVPKRADSWASLSRWRRGIFGGGTKRLVSKVILFILFLACAATLGLGLWGTGKALKESLAAGAATSFGCAAPV